ncbi:astacin, partial [Ancylostoma duodenale]
MNKFEKVKKIFGSVSVAKIRERLSKLKDKIKKMLELTPKMLASLKEKLAKLRPIKRVQVHEEGDTIEEINQISGVDGYLFQSDIVLTEYVCSSGSSIEKIEQANEIEKDIDDVISGNPRRRRQAFKDRRYPGTLWENGVNYYFDYNANEKLRSVFKKGANAWQTNTCINFKEDSQATDKIRVFYENGCWSFVGRRGGKQDLSLGKGCDAVATATHEL